MSVVSTDLDSTIFFGGLLEVSNQLMFAGVFRSHISFASDTWLVCSAQSAFTASKTITFKKNGVTFATAVFAAGGTVPTITMVGGIVSFNPDNDIIAINLVGTPDATGGDIYFSFLGTRS